MRDLGEVIAMVSIIAGSGILAMSYAAAYMIGRSHGRRAERFSPAALDHAESDQRLQSLESSMQSLTGSVERIRDAQRLLVAQQDHLSRKIGGPDRNNVVLPPIQPHNTPS